jgi:hypothetical protein
MRDCSILVTLRVFFAKSLRDASQKSLSMTQVALCHSEGVLREESLADPRLYVGRIALPNRCAASAS